MRLVIVLHEVIKSKRSDFTSGKHVQKDSCLSIYIYTYFHTEKVRVMIQVDLSIEVLIMNYQLSFRFNSGVRIFLQKSSILYKK